ncbi:MAG: hypothetical protein IRY87_18235 [Acetobacteraceae bacterium]|nr:hypothetical protein [Acetobacteraceae bacterium]
MQTPPPSEACGPGRRSEPVGNQRKVTMRGILLWLLGIPIPIIILLYLFHVI